MCEIKVYDEVLSDKIINFLQKVMPESGRKLELDGRHKFYHNISNYFEKFWYINGKETIVGTVGIKQLDMKKCELKSLFLYNGYQGKGLGKQLLETAIAYARTKGYAQIYLDTLSTSEKAIRLYQKSGFVFTERYNDNQVADVFMVMDLDNDFMCERNTK